MCFIFMGENQKIVLIFVKNALESRWEEMRIKSDEVNLDCEVEVVELISEFSAFSHSYSPDIHFLFSTFNLKYNYEISSQIWVGIIDLIYPIVF